MNIRNLDLDRWYSAKELGRMHVPPVSGQKAAMLVKKSGLFESRFSPKGYRLQYKAKRF